MGQGWETFKVKGEDLLKCVKGIVHEGNVRRIIIKQGAKSVMEFPVTVGVVGAVAAPALAALGALAALLTECTIEVERTADPVAAVARTPTSQRRAGRRKKG